MFYYDWWNIRWWAHDIDVIDLVQQKYNPKNKQFEKMKKKWFFTAKKYKLYHIDWHRMCLPHWVLDQVYERDYHEMPSPYQWNPISLDKFNCKPYDYQQEIIDILVKRKTWLIQAREWWGKTIAMAWVINKLQVKTLIVVPLVWIATGMLKKMQEYFWEERVSVYKPWAEITDITICVWPTFNKYRKDFAYKIDMLLVDEAHMNFLHVWAKKKKWSEFTDRMEIYCKFPAKYMFWFTATPESNDVDDNSFEYVFWKKIVAEWHQPHPVVLSYKHNTWIEMFRDRQHLQELLLDNQDRINKLCSIVKETMKYRWMWVVFCDRIEMVEKVTEQLKSIWVAARSYTSKSQKRDEIVESLRWKNWVIVSTYQTLKAWVDYPELDTAFYFMWVKFSATVKQLVGRVLRVVKWKKIPIMIDFVDDVSPMYLQSRQRVKAYKSRWWWEPLKYDIDQIIYLSSKVM